MPAEYYVWSVDGKPVRVHISLSLIERLSAIVIERFRITPENPMESAGVLFGRVVQDGHEQVIAVGDFEPFDEPPARLQSDPARAVVGLYRGGSGPELRLNEVDASRIERLFKRPELIYLLVIPQAGAPARAAIFIQERGQIQGFKPYREFPFHAALLKSG
jgi:hypothetical protein